MAVSVITIMLHTHCMLSLKDDNGTFTSQTCFIWTHRNKHEEQISSFEKGRQNIFVKKSLLFD